MVRGVISVEPIVGSVEVAIAKNRADNEWKRKLWELTSE
ncbi:conserved hypothetical protein [Roseibium sp. TrichSKD4]|nr:conserved hypothetical protein [Roseibium sp. TrichSKD4]